MINRIVIIGNVGGEPSVHITESGRKKVELSVATNNSYINKSTGEEINETDWHRIEFWGKLGDIVESYTKKGQLVMIEGMQKNISYETEEGKKSRSFIKPSGFKILSPKEQENENN